MQTLELAITSLALRATALGHRLRDAHEAEEGQTTAEYVAVIVLIAGLIGLVAGNDTIRQAIIDAISAAFGNVEEQVTEG